MPLIDPDHVDGPFTAEDIPPILTRAEILELSGASRSATKRWALKPLDRATIPDAHLRRLGNPRIVRKRTYPYLYAREDVLPYIARYFSLHAGRHDREILPWTVVITFQIKRGGWSRKRVARNIARQNQWAREHQLHIGRCLHRTQTVKVWAARWIQENMMHYGWYRRDTNKTVWFATLMKEQVVPLDGVFIPLPEDSWK